VSVFADHDNELLLAGQHRILGLVATGRPLHEVLEALTLFMEEASGKAVCSVLLLGRDGKRLTVGAAPHLPREFNDLIDQGFEAGPCAGSCGTAVYRRERVVVQDTLADPLWEPYRAIAERFALRACTSAPIFGSKGQVLGAFAFYYSEPMVPSLRDLRLIETSRAVAGLAIERQQTEDTLREREERLEHARRMEAVGRLAGGIAHDFNNLLTVINGYASFVLGNLRAGEPFYDELLQIRNAGDRAASLTRQLLAFSRKQVVQPEVFDLNETVAETRSMLARVLGEHVELVTDLGVDLPRVSADPGQVSQMLVNLAINARDAMPNGGTLTIATRSVSDDEAAALGGESHANAYVLLSVADNGVGMDDETQQRVFEPFFTTKMPGKGTGLGLATVYALVTQNNGFVELVSAPGRGATFRIYLPSAASPRPRRSTGSGELGAREGSETVLLAEDEPSVRAVARSILTSCGYTVIEACDGRDALDVAARHAGPIDLLVTDVVMPRMGGRELSLRLAAARPELKVLFVSGYTDDVETVRDVSAGQVHWLDKPFSPRALAEAVRRTLDEEPV
jgi:signal transduction histidine kinase/ActR/RegA family two-component response regulator